MPGSHNNSDSGYRPDIDGLRAVAVLLVVGFHAGIRSLTGGFVGVDAFFVISGYLISSIIYKQLESGRWSIADFYRRRIRRIFPALTVVLLSVLVYGWTSLLPEEFSRLAWNIVAGGTFSSNLLVMNGSGYFDTASALKPLLHLWSLAIEEQFYLLWPVLLVLIWKVRFRLQLIFSLFAVSLFVSVLVVHTDRTAAYYLPQARFWELLIGAIIAFLNQKGPQSTGARRVLGRLTSSPSTCNAASVVGILMIIGSAVAFDSDSMFPGYFALIPTVGTALLIMPGERSWLNRVVLSSRPFLWVGLISYPLYLWHWPLLSALSIADRSTPLLRTCAVALAFLLSWATWRWVELPIRTGEASSFLSRRSVPLLAASMTLLVALGAGVISQHGVSQRYSPELRQLLAFQEAPNVNAWREHKCFIDHPPEFHGFSSDCVDSVPGAQPLVVLWGDSHAADLYPGIRKIQETGDFRLAQFTAAGCPPILDFDPPASPNCREINLEAIAKIKRSHPDTVIIVAQRWLYLTTDTRSKIAETIDSLKSSGVRQVLVVGPNPEWHQDLARLVVKRVAQDPQHRIAERLPDPLDENSLREENEMTSMAASQRVPYLSPVRAVCDASGCLTRVEAGGKKTLLAFDTHHLTIVGSEYLANSLLAPYLRTRMR